MLLLRLRERETFLVFRIFFDVHKRDYDADFTIRYKGLWRVFQLMMENGVERES